MKQIIFSIALLFFSATTFAQSAAVKKVEKSVFKLTTYNQNGDILSTSQGFFVNSNGDAVSLWSPFKGATKAIVEDETGRKYNVETLYGADELYDVCKFHIGGKTAGVTLASKPATTGSKVWVVNYSKDVSPTKEFTIRSVEQFGGKYAYYLLSSAPNRASCAACPVVNSAGQVIGLLHVSDNGNDASVTDINYINGFTVADALSVNDRTLGSTAIRLAYPADKSQALALLMLAGQRCDSLTRVAYINDFIAKFPTEANGYSILAEEELRANRFNKVDQLMETAIKNADKKDEAHSAYAKLIYQKDVYYPQVEYPAWTLDKALSEIELANKANPQPAYKHQEAQVRFMKGEYQTAYDMFMQLTKSNIRNGELFYEAAQCKQQLNAPTEEYIALLDSAVNAHPDTHSAMAAPYVLTRANAWNAAQNYRNAVRDYNLYDSIMGGRPISPEFYYVRSQCEMQIHQYQQALNDINRAIILTRTDPQLWAEKASLHLRFKQHDDALRSADTCLQLDPENLDALLIKGIVLCQQKKKKEGMALLQQAKDKGDERAESYMKKYK